MQATINFIGRIHSSLKSIEECPLQENEDAPQAVLEIFPQYHKGIRTLTAGSEIVLITWLHAADRTVLECFPRREFDSPTIGVFSTRSPDRPNPLGIHTVKIISISPQGAITVSALEALDQTPLVDIKPVWNPKQG